VARSTPFDWAPKSWRKMNTRDVVSWLLLVAFAAVLFFPIYWMFVTAVRPKDELFNGEFDLWPSQLMWSNFAEGWSRLPFGQFYINSFAIAIIAVIVTVFINLLCGYTFAKYKFPGRNIIFLLLISTLMIPIQVIMVPEFLLITKLGWVNTYWGVIAPRAAEAFGIFMVRQFMLAIPDELIEAGRLDGAGEFAIFWKWPLVALQQQSAFTVPLGLNLLKGQYYTEWTSIMGMGLVSIIPMLIVFIFFQRYFIQGIANTGLK
jgi:alpha-1,4-digalacturonate transport system permease protein